MARAGRKDRGLLPVKDPDGRVIGWKVRLYHDGRERRFGSFKTKTQARDFYEKAKQEQKEGKFFPERYQKGGYEVVEGVIDRYMAGNRKKSRGNDELHATWWKARFAGTRLQMITPAVIEEAKRELFTKGFAPQTVLHYLKFLRHVLNLVVRDGKLDRTPFAQDTLPKPTAGRTRFLSPEEERQVVEALGPVYGPWARLAILTGMRRDEQFALRWSDVDLDHGILTLPTTKKGDVQYVHLNEEAKAILGGLDSWQRSVWVFPSQNPITHVDPRHFYARIWTPAVKQAGIAWATWHDLRHTFASRLAMNGASESTLAALLRHSGTALVKRYAHLSPSHLKAAVEGITAFGKGHQALAPGIITGADEAAISIPTVTKTGIVESAEVSGDAEVSEKTGAPDRI